MAYSALFDVIFYPLSSKIFEPRLLDCFSEWAGMQGKTRMGSWAVAQSPILGTTIAIDRLNRRCYESRLERYKRLSSQLNEPLYTLLRNKYPVNIYSERRSLVPARTEAKLCSLIKVRGVLAVN